MTVIWSPSRDRVFVWLTMRRQWRETSESFYIDEASSTRRLKSVRVVQSNDIDGCYWEMELRSRWSKNLEQSSGRSATPIAVTADIWTKTETVFVWAMSAPEDFFKSRYTNVLIIIIIIVGVTQIWANDQILDDLLLPDWWGLSSLLKVRWSMRRDLTMCSSILDMTGRIEIGR